MVSQFILALLIINIDCIGRNLFVKWCPNNINMKKVFKMANKEYFKVRLNFSNTGTQRYARKRIHHEFEETIDKSVPGSLFGITRLVLLNSEPRDIIVYPILKLMIDA